MSILWYYFRNLNGKLGNIRIMHEHGPKLADDSGKCHMIDK